MKTPEEIYRIQQETLAIGKPWLPKHLRNQDFDGLRFVANGQLVELYYLVMLQLRWGFEGLAATMDEMATLPPMLDAAFTGMKKPWDAYQGRLDGYLRLTYLLGLPTVDKDIFEKWAAYADSSPNFDCMHKCEVALESVLQQGRSSRMPCSFTTGKKFKLEAATYKNYFDLADAVIAEDKKLASERVRDAVKLYRQRARSHSGPGYYGYNGRNSYLFDFELTAILEFARRQRGWELPSDEAHETVLNNAAAFREANPTE